MEGVAAGLSEYLQKECDYLRGRLSANIDETATVERHAIAATGAVWAWIGANPRTSAAELCWLPLLLTVFLGVRALAIFGRIRGIRSYLAELESGAGVPPGLGWMTSFEARGGRWRTLSAVLFWAGINSVNLSLAVVAQHALVRLHDLTPVQ